MSGRMKSAHSSRGRSYERPGFSALKHYNLETILSEKLQTVLARGLLNTRMRDFYDIKTLLAMYEQNIDNTTLKRAFDATCKKRNTENLKVEASKLIVAISNDK